MSILRIMSPETLNVPESLARSPIPWNFRWIPQLDELKTCPDLNLALKRDYYEEVYFQLRYGLSWHDRVMVALGMDGLVGPLPEGGIGVSIPDAIYWSGDALALHDEDGPAFNLQTNVLILRFRIIGYLPYFERTIVLEDGPPTRRSLLTEVAKIVKESIEINGGLSLLSEYLGEHWMTLTAPSVIPRVIVAGLIHRGKNVWQPLLLWRST